MNCIDAVEGTAKSMLDKLLQVADEYRLDASEYIRNVKAVIEAVVAFVTVNPEVSDNPEIIQGVLYDYAKTLWVVRLEKSVNPDPAGGAGADIDYQAYCYDYVYMHGNYPR